MTIPSFFPVLEAAQQVLEIECPFGCYDGLRDSGGVDPDTGRGINVSCDWEGHPLLDALQKAVISLEVALSTDDQAIQATRKWVDARWSDGTCTSEMRIRLWAALAALVRLPSLEAQVAEFHAMIGPVADLEALHLADEQSIRNMSRRIAELEAQVRDKHASGDRKCQ